MSSDSSSSSSSSSSCLPFDPECLSEDFLCDLPPPPPPVVETVALAVVTVTAAVAFAVDTSAVTFAVETAAVALSTAVVEFALDVFQKSSGSDEGFCVEIANSAYVTYEQTHPQPPPGFKTYCKDMGWGHFVNDTINEIIWQADCVLEGGL